ncbi:hypothetical protein H181DRAFT_02815 [Streptomyces sp. WMMB 714]|jgi:hypothetical protein|uniref:MFS transporter small subunit n=1 Tax=Streptomyces sp. WMMB 714 TaxID=1286822 RepID=UPI000823EA0B|nr:hypothetical protein [Streptomyces sp. WMMB 714]SCK34126.1 hypothetical protein H181DRAFT_02815 [Streptomyces sp. WMMB 714]
MTTGDSSTPDGGTVQAGGARAPLGVLAWLWVGLPMAYGLYELIQKAAQLFTG